MARTGKKNEQRQARHWLPALLLILCAAIVPASAAASEPLFEATGSMAVARYSTAAAPLADGSVLLAGGQASLGPKDHDGYSLTSAEIYDPVTGSFSTAAGAMTQRRQSAAAATLPDGRVLILGGANNVGPPLASAEIYDPETETFSSASSMAVARFAPVAAPLPDGRILVAGGSGSSGLQRSSAEIYDPETETFSSTGEMGSARVGAAAAPLSDGRILVAGGASGSSLVASAEIYDPAEGTFGSTGAMTEARTGDAAPLADGRVLVIGRPTQPFGSPVSTSADIYDPEMGTFSELAATPGQRSAPAAAPLPGGNVLIAGGSVGGSPIASAETLVVPPAPKRPAPDSGATPAGSSSSPARETDLGAGASPTIRGLGAPLKPRASGWVAVAVVDCPALASEACEVTSARASLRTGGRSTPVAVRTPHWVQPGRSATVALMVPLTLAESLSKAHHGRPTVKIGLRAVAPGGADVERSLRRVLIP